MLAFFASLTNNAAIRDESKPPDRRQPIRLSVINRFLTDTVNKSFMLAK